MYNTFTGVFLYCEITTLCIGILIYFMISVFRYYANNNRASVTCLKLAFLFTVIFLSCEMTWIVLEYFGDRFALYNYIINALYFVFGCSAMLCYMLFCEIEMQTKLIKSTIGKAFIVLPLLCTIFLVSTSYQNHLVFYIDENGIYTHGPIFMLLPLIVFGYMLFASLHAVFHSKYIQNTYQKQRDIYFAQYMLPSVVLGCVESLTGFPFLGIGATISFVGLYISLQKLENTQKDLVVDSLSEDFGDIIYVDMTAGYHEFIRSGSSKETRAQYFQHPDIFLVLEDVINHVSNEEDLEPMKNALSKERILYELRNHPSYYVDLRSFLHGEAEYFQIKFVRNASSFTHDGKLKSFIMAVRSMDAYIQREQAQEKAVRDLMHKESNYQRALYTDTLGSYEINLTKDEIISEIYENVNGRKMDITERLPLPQPIKYSDFVDYYGKNCVKSEKEKYYEVLDREDLIHRYENGYNFRDVTFNIVSPYGQHKTAKAILFLSQDEYSGDILALLVAKDVTIEEQKEDEIRQNNEIIQILAREYSSVYYVNLDTEEVIPYVNNASTHPSSIEIYRKGIRYSDSFEIFVSGTVAKEDRAQLLELASVEHLRSELITKTTFTTIFRTYENGQYIYQEMKVVKVPSADDETHCVVIAFANKNEEIRKEQTYRHELQSAKINAETANRAKSTFLFNMSHDIRTPMNAILGFTDMAQKHYTEPEKVADYLDKVKVSGEHLLHLINDVLDMSRIESGKTSLQNAPLNLESFMQEVITMTEPQMKDKKMTFRYRPNFTHKEIIADKLHLNEILLNVIGNAIKYTPEGGTISLHIDEAGRNRSGKISYIFEITDNGIGMSKQFVTHIFEPFDREQNSTVSGIQGTGLGMSITKNLIDLMGGIIAIDSEIGKGTTVRFQLDFTEGINEEVLTASESSPENPLSLEGKRILVVDDNDLNREIAVYILEEVNATVEEVTDGDEALELVENSPAGYFDCILMDIQMVRMNGYLATEMIRNIADLEKSQVPIIAMTANAFDEDKQKARDCGMNGHLAKPIHADVMIETILNILESRK